MKREEDLTPTPKLTHRLLESNQTLAIEVRSAFVRMGWTVESASTATGLSISVLNQLRHGRSVRPSSLRRFAEAVDGAGAFEKWFRIAQASQSPPLARTP